MRILDLIRLAIESMWLQKIRAMLSMSGVVIGAFILLAVFAAADGVSQTIHRILQSQDYLRTILVTPDYSFDSEIEEPQIEFDESIASARKERLKQRALDEWRAQLGYWHFHPLTSDDISAIREIEFVESVTPNVVESCVVEHENFERRVMWEGCAPKDRRLSDRLLVGNLPKRPTTNEIAISEYLAFVWGYESLDEVKSLIGSTIDVRIRFQDRQLSMTAEYLLQRIQGQQTDDSEEPIDLESITRSSATYDELTEIIAQLREIPELLRDSGADESAIDLIQSLLDSRFANDTSEEPIVEREDILFQATIVGIIREENFDEPREPFDLTPTHYGTDVWFHEEAAVEMHGWFPESGSQGFSSAIVKVTDESKLEVVHNDIEEIGVGVRSLLNFLTYVEEQIKFGKWVIAVIAATIFVVAGLGITNTMVMTVMERRFDIGVMKGLGATQNQIVAIFLTEGACLGAIGCAIAWTIAFTLSKIADSYTQQLLSNRIGVDVTDSIFHFSPSLFAIVCVFSMVVTVVSTIVPAWRASRINPIESMRTR